MHYADIQMNNEEQRRHPTRSNEQRRKTRHPLLRLSEMMRYNVCAI